MSDAGLAALVASGLQALNILSPGSPQRNIGGIIAQVTFEETGTDSMTITEYPVEQGANKSDHSYVNPRELTLRVGWSDSGIAALSASISSALGSQVAGEAIGAFTSPSYVTGIYNQLLALQATRQPFIIVTGKQVYRNMLFKALTQTTNVDSENALIVTATCRELLTATTQTQTIPDQSVQANPQNTASPVQVGPVQPVAANSVNRGAFLPAPVLQDTPVYEIPALQPQPVNPISTGGGFPAPHL